MAALGRKIEKGDQENRIFYMRQIGKIWNGCFRKEGKKKDERHRTIQDLEMAHQEIPPFFYMQE